MSTDTAPLEPAPPVSPDRLTIRRRRIHTDEGVIGQAHAGDEDATLAQIMDVVRTEIEPRLIGQNAFAVERCWELGYPVTFDQLRDRRIGLVALAGVDTAIWDAIGRALGRPLVELWGGHRDRLPVNIIGGYYGPADEIRSEVEEWLELGFRGCKFKLGSRRRPRTPSAHASCARSPAMTS